MGYAEFLQSLFPDSHDTQAEVYSALLGAIGYALDQFDPVQIGLAAQFAVSSATGSGLDDNGQDWGVSRRSGESDADYRARILAELPLYAQGPTTAAMKAVVQPFTGTVPVLFEYGPSAFIMGESAISEAGFCTLSDEFTFEVDIQNPSNTAYNHLDLERAVSKAKLARSTAIIYHNGPDTSPAAEAADAVVTITQ